MLGHRASDSPQFPELFSFALSEKEVAEALRGIDLAEMPIIVMKDLLAGRSPDEMPEREEEGGDDVGQLGLGRYFTIRLMVFQICFSFFDFDTWLWTIF